jgi:hypothetical protein
MEKENKYLTIQQAARMLGVTELTLRNWDKAGKFLAARHPINNYRIYASGQVEELLAKLGKKPSATVAKSPAVGMETIEAAVVAVPANTPKKLNVQFIDDDSPEDPTAGLL